MEQREHASVYRKVEISGLPAKHNTGTDRPDEDEAYGDEKTDERGLNPE